MDRVEVSSSNLVSIGYDSEENILEIEFTHGTVYQYFDVPKRVHRNLMATSSHGKYFHKEIKGQYEHRME